MSKRTITKYFSQIDAEEALREVGFLVEDIKLTRDEVWGLLLDPKKVSCLCGLARFQITRPNLREDHVCTNCGRILLIEYWYSERGDLRGGVIGIELNQR